MTTGLIGPLVGPVSDIPASSTSVPADLGDGPQFTIGDLSFRLAISDERPYERATAQFRKEQFDATQTVGDQSLTGYWTRGQLSFHKGAGVTYYEVLEGESVLNRFRDGEGIDPFEPGEVTLQSAWAQATTTATFTAVTHGGSGNGFLALLDNGVLKYATSLTGATSSYAPTAGTVTHAATGPLCAYVATTSNKIERVAIAAGAPASGAIYTHSASFNGLFYAKDRLWAVDSTGKWYQGSANPDGAPLALGTSNLVFTAGDAWDANWSLTETPSAVLIGNGSKVYAVTIDPDGAVPTLSGPVQVAELPTGEVLRGLQHHLGFLVMVTSEGLRVGVVSDANAVTYGPLLFEWGTAPTASTTVAVKGTSVYVAERGATAGVYQIDLAQQVGEGLEFAWTKHANPFSGSPSRTGVFTWGGSTLVAWSTTAAKYEGGDKAASGSLTTGYHRFGTLEFKKFHSVHVRVGGTGGTINVSKVLSDESEVSLLTVDVTQTEGETITLRSASVMEMIGLKFTLTRSGSDPTVGPTLLGYQLKALPAPERQRMIRVPLKLFDVERSAATPPKGYEGSAWARLEALEDMERSGSTFVFQDFRTGEAGECFIEQVEHRGTTPPGPNNSGYGGIVWLTLRKL